MRLIKTQEAVVISVDGDLAQVKMSRHNDCASCGACSGMSAAVVLADNSIHASVGQSVLVSMPQNDMLKAAFLVYIMPLVFILAAIYTGTVIAEQVGVDSIYSYVSTFLLFGAFVVWLIRRYELKLHNNRQKLPTVIKLL